MSSLFSPLPLRDATSRNRGWAAPGGSTPARIPLEPGYQVPLAEAVRSGAGVPTGAVGLITEPAQAEAIVAEGRSDVVLLASGLLRDPHWPLRAAAELGADVAWPSQHEIGRAHV